MSTLFEPTPIHTLSLKNRFVRSATWTGTATEEGEVTPELINRMVLLAEGEVGLIVTGHAYVQPEGQASFRQLAIYDDRFVDGLKALTEKVHQAGGKIALQLAHAGMFPLDGAPGPTRIVSLVDGNDTGEQRGMTKLEIEELVSDFVQGGKRAKQAGFDGVQLHAAHGYLLSQFLSPHYNKREDAYGGDAAGRANVAVAILKELRRALGDDFPLLVKMNGQDYLGGGLDTKGAVEIAQMLQGAGCNALELSGGVVRNIKYSPSRMGINTEKKEAYFREEAKTLKAKIDIPLILVGGMRSFSIAESVVSDGVADMIAISRPLICEPDLIARWKKGDQSRARCRSDNRCFRPGFAGKGIACAHVPPK